MERNADGDRAAFVDGFSMLRPKVHAFARTLLGVEPDADDATQIALTELFEHAPDHECDGDLVARAFAACASECRTMRRRRLRSREVDMAAASHVAASDSPEDELARRELEAAAYAVLGTLRSIDRETLRITLDGDLPEGVRPDAVRKRRERAFARLRSSWRKIHGRE